MLEGAQPFTPRGVPLSAVVARFGFEVVTDSGVDFTTRMVTEAKVNRPGMQWAGYSERFPSERIQLIGHAEVDFLVSLEPEVREARLEQYAQLGMPAVLVARDLQLGERMLAMADAYEIPILRTPLATQEISGQLTWFLAMELAPRVVLHGGLVDVLGEGVLILGDSGVGKSETALELIRRGHRLIADDTVEVRRPTDQALIGRSPGRQRYFLEVKGIGIVNVRRMYGVGSVKPSAEVTMVVSLVRPESVPVPGSGEERRVDTVDVLGVPLPRLRLPMRPGRNAAILTEAAATEVRARRSPGPAADPAVAPADEEAAEALGVPR